MNIDNLQTRKVSFGAGQADVQDSEEPKQQHHPNWGTLVEEVGLDTSKQFKEQFEAAQTRFREAEEAERLAKLVSVPFE